MSLALGTVGCESLLLLNPIQTNQDHDKVGYYLTLML